MVGRRIDEILAEKANSKNGNSYYLSPIVVPVVSSFKRIYKSQLSKNKVFKGKPLHTIEESSEVVQNEINSQNLDTKNDCDHNVAVKNLHNFELQDDDELTLFGIRYLFDIEESQENSFENCIWESKESKESHFDSAVFEISSLVDANIPSASPSISLMQQFEMEAKTEAAIIIQQWYRQVLQRSRFLMKKKAAITIQRFVRQRLKNGINCL